MNVALQKGYFNNVPDWACFLLFVVPILMLVIVGLLHPETREHYYLLHTHKKMSLIIFIFSGALLGALIWFLFFITHPSHSPIDTNVNNSSSPSHVSLDANSLQQIQNIFETSISNLKGQEKSDVSDIRFPGLSFSLLMRIEKVINGRDNYIFDYGENLERNRFSGYIDTETNLCFRFIDQNSNPFIVKINPALQTFDVGKFFYLKCEYGYSNEFSFIRVGINGNQVAENYQRPPVSLSVTMDKIHGAIGFDLSKTNGGVFMAANFTIYQLTLDRNVENYWLDYNNKDMKTSRLYISFNGSNGVTAPYFSKNSK